MGKRRREVGVIASIGNSELRELLWPEGVVALVIGGGGGTALLHSTTVAERLTLVGDTLNSIGVLLGVVFAAFALLISLLSDEYVKRLDLATDGIKAFLRPFMVAVGVQVASLVLALSYRAVAADVTGGVEIAWFLIWATVFMFALADVVALARNISMHGVARAEHLRREGNVRPIQKAGGR